MSNLDLVPAASGGVALSRDDRLRRGVPVPFQGPLPHPRRSPTYDSGALIRIRPWSRCFHSPATVAPDRKTALASVSHSRILGGGDVAELPTSVEVRPERAVEAKVGEPVPAPDGLDPVGLLALRGARAEPQVD